MNSGGKKGALLARKGLRDFGCRARQALSEVKDSHSGPRLLGTR